MPTPASLTRFIAACSAFACLLVGSADAAYTVTFRQVGADVVATGVGSLDLSAISPADSSGINSSGVQANYGLAVGAGPVAASLYAPISGPTAIGPGTTLFAANSGTGTQAGVASFPSATYVVVDSTFTGGALSGSSTWNNTTIAALGLAPGTYTWTWGAGPALDSFTVIVTGSQTGVPTLSQWGLLLMSLSLGGFALYGARQKN